MKDGGEDEEEEKAMARDGVFAAVVVRRKGAIARDGSGYLSISKVNLSLSLSLSLSLHMEEVQSVVVSG